MERPVCYDVTRLLTRVLNATPNGIDRVDFALAAHFLKRRVGATFGGVATGFGARLLDGAAAAEAIEAIGTHWRENDPAPEGDPAFRRVAAFLAGDGVLPHFKRQVSVGRRAARATSVMTWVRRHGIPLRRSARAHLPADTLYLNASQFPLWVASSFAWLERRPDVRGVFFLHDLLPIRMPEYFRVGEEQRHRNRLRNFARFGAAAIVTTRTVANDLEAHLATLGRADCPLFVAPTPIAPVFATSRQIDPALARHPFFVFCSTLEPRKNHLMLLAVWRVLAARLGPAAPKLVLVGTRGWHYDAIIDLIARSPPLRSHVIEVAGLSTPGLKRLIDNAQALLMPSFGEGYGLPVHEALTAGAPVIASDVAAFREIAADNLTLLSPLDGEAWLAAITDRAFRPRPAGRPREVTPIWSDYFAKLEAFLDRL